MAIANAQTPDASALRLVAGLDLKHHPRQHTSPTGRWPMGRTARDDRPYRPSARSGQMAVTAHGVTSPRGGARRRLQQGW
jgi:hypothetical protein